MPTLMPNQHSEDLLRHEVRDLQEMRESMRLLGDAVRSLHTVSPQMAAGVAATENAWREMSAEFGLLTGPEVARLAGSRQSGGGYANDLRARRAILGIRRRNAYVYPGFQFDDAGRVRSVVPAVLAAAGELGVSDDGVAQWFCLPSASLDGRRPVDVLEDEMIEMVVRVFRSRFGAQW